MTVELASKIRDVPDFPKPGILFKDITTLLKDGVAFKAAIDGLEDLREAHDDQTVCLVAHGMTNRIIAAYYLGTLPRVAQGNSANTNVTVIETDGRAHRVLRLFDDAHVPHVEEAPEG